MPAQSSCRIVFYGTPEFAVPSLRILVEQGYQVAAVVTAPDKPAGRGLQLKASPVKQAALELGLPLLQPESLKDENFISSLTTIQPDLQVVVAFRKMPAVVWQMPLLGTFNLHASLLPDYRGAAPINWAVMNGEEITGLTTFFINEVIDTGDILLRKELPIDFLETAGELHDRMMMEGASLVLQTVQGVLGDSLHPLRQNATGATERPLKPAPKLYKDDCVVNWSHPVRSVHHFIRGLSPYPGAVSTLTDINGNSWQVKLLRGCPVSVGYSGNTGSIQTDKKTFLYIKASDGWYSVEEIQLAGRKSMKLSEFLRGFTFEEGMKFISK